MGCIAPCCLKVGTTFGCRAAAKNWCAAQALWRFPSRGGGVTETEEMQFFAHCRSRNLGFEIYDIRSSYAYTAQCRGRDGWIAQPPRQSYAVVLKKYSQISEYSLRPGSPK